MKSATLTPAAGRPAQIDAAGVSPEGVLRDMLAASSDACWCMEFAQPVDVTADDLQIVHQIFDNGPVWRHCNPAMERLYRLPPGQTLEGRAVHDIFPDNSSNRDFLLNLIANDFEVDGAPALDRRYDGLEIYVENDVRAHIADGKLYRLFGTVRNVGKHRRREMALSDQVDALDGIIAAISRPVLAIDAQGDIERVNPAAVAYFGVKRSGMIGQSFEGVIAAAGFASSLSDLSGMIVRVRALGIPMTFRLDAGLGAALCKVAPWTTAQGTGLVVEMLSQDAGDELT